MSALYCSYTPYEVGLLKKFLQRTMSEYPEDVSFTLVEVYAMAVDVLERQETRYELGLTNHRANIVVLAMLLARHISSFWFGAFTMQMTGWSYRLTDKFKHEMSEPLNLIFSAAEYGGLSREEVASMEMLRLATTRNGPLTMAYMLAMPSLYKSGHLLPDNAKWRAFTDTAESVMARWRDMADMISVDDYLALPAENDVGPLYTHTVGNEREDWTAEVLSTFEIVFESDMDEIDDMTDTTSDEELDGALDEEPDEVLEEALDEEELELEEKVQPS